MPVAQEVFLKGGSEKGLEGATSLWCFCKPQYLNSIRNGLVDGHSRPKVLESNRNSLRKQEARENTQVQN